MPVRLSLACLLFLTACTQGGVNIYLAKGATIEVRAHGKCAVHQNLTSDTTVLVVVDPKSWPDFERDNADQNGRQIARTSRCPS